MIDASDKIRRWRESPATMVRELFEVDPDLWQEEVLEVFPRQPRIAMQAPIDVDSIVPTPDGMRRWGDVQVGDNIFAEDGTPTTVLRRFDAGSVNLYRVTLCDGTFLDVSADHQWDVTTQYDRKRGKRRTVTTSELMGIPLYRGRQRLVAIPIGGPAQFPHAKLDADPYIFGLWIGDGIANEPRLICPDHGIRRAIVGRGQSISESRAVPKRIGLCGFMAALRSTGMSSCRSFEKYIPEAYRMASVSQRMDLLRGIMDSDGTVTRNGQTYLATCSQKLVKDFSWLGRSLGYYVSIGGPYKINGGENRDSYRVTISGGECPFLADTSKKKRWKRSAPYKHTRYIDSVRCIGRGEAMCVEVSHPSHCLQATDFIVTHNCKGPGKTSVLAWLSWNYLLTRPEPNIGAISITGQNLADGLWKEMAKWRDKSPLLQAAFTWTKTRIFANEAPATWFMAAKSWSQTADREEQAKALAGFHADYVMFVIDESGAMPDAVMVSAEAALSSCVEGHIVQAGNPTHLSGPLYRAATSARHLWHVVEITGDPDDPKRSPRISIEYAKEQIAQYGRDNPWVIVNIFGRFPPSSLNALIGPDEVSAAMKRYYREYEIGQAPLVLGIDVARFGDDQSVIFPRRGIQAFAPRKLRNVDSTQGAGTVSRMWEDLGAAAAFIDNTGGFGSGWIDQLNLLHRSPIGVGFAEKAQNSSRYVNKRAEMYFEAVEWIKRGGALPESSELAAALTQTTYTFQGDRFLLEPKDDVKVKLGYSPDEADAFVLTFAQPVSLHANRAPGKPMHTSDYDPFASLSKAVQHSYSHDPFAGT